jgi:hypothetical protein
MKSGKKLVTWQLIDKDGGIRKIIFSRTQEKLCSVDLLQTTLHCMRYDRQEVTTNYFNKIKCITSLSGEIPFLLRDIFF